MDHGRIPGPIAYYGMKHNLHRCYYTTLLAVVLFAGILIVRDQVGLFSGVEVPTKKEARGGGTTSSSAEKYESGVWSGLFFEFGNVTNMKSNRQRHKHKSWLRWHNEKRSALPSWWTDPRQCTALAFDCTREGQGFGNGREKTLGSHIQMLDTCPPNTVTPIWQQVGPYWSDLLDLVLQLPPRVQFIHMGDSTSWQQARSMNCFLEEALANSGGEVIGFENRSNAVTIPEHVPNRWRNLPCGRAYLQRTNGREYLVCTRFANKSFFDERNISKAIEETVVRRGNETDVHLVISVNMGAWFNCNGQKCPGWHVQIRQLQNWWKGYQENAPNTTLIIRDALPQHFGSADGRFPGQSGGCPALKDRVSSGLQAIKVRDPETCRNGQSIVVDDPERAMFRNPVWGVTVRLPIHNVRPGDCTHYCTAISTLWNIMMVGIAVNQFRRTLPSMPRDGPVGGEHLVSLLLNRSFAETRLDLLAANDLAC